MYMEFFFGLIILTTVAWALIFSKGWVWAKALFICGLVCASLLTYQKIEEYQGTPLLVDKIPADIIVYGFEVKEQAGSICLYFKNTQEPEDFPLSIVAPYQREQHQGLQQGQEQFEGAPFRMQTNDGEEGEGSGEGEGDGEGGEGAGEESEGDGTGSLSTKSHITVEIGELPPTRLPRKIL